MNKKSKILNGNALYTLIAIAIGFLVGAILLLAIGNNPAVAYQKLFEGVFSKPKFITYSIVYASPLILTELLKQKGFYSELYHNQFVFE